MLLHLLIASIRFALGGYWTLSDSERWHSTSSNNIRALSVGIRLEKSRAEVSELLRFLLTLNLKRLTNKLNFLSASPKRCDAIRTPTSKGSQNFKAKPVKEFASFVQNETAPQSEKVSRNKD